MLFHILVSVSSNVRQTRIQYFCSSAVLATFQVLGGHMWLICTEQCKYKTFLQFQKVLLDSAGLEFNLNEKI